MNGLSRKPRSSLVIWRIGQFGTHRPTVGCVYFDRAMTRTVRTFRMLVFVLTAAGLVANGAGFVPALCAADEVKQQPAGCCQRHTMSETNAGCSHACCQTQAPKPEQNSSDRSNRNQDRIDGKAGWVAVALIDLSPGLRVERYGSSLAPASGSPSLVTQHVRMQT